VGPTKINSKSELQTENIEKRCDRS